MPTSSVFHFFAHLILQREDLPIPDKLEEFDFPRHMIAAEQSQSFPDFILRTNPDSEFPGGEFIELKDAKSYQISSFNSAMPAATKSISALPNTVIDVLHNAGEVPDAVPEREVYYLIRGVKTSTALKTVLVSGAFFETTPIEDVLADAFEQVAGDSASQPIDASALAEQFVVRQSNFAASRHVDGASIKIRFRVMAEVDPQANLFVVSRYPMIGDNTLSFVSHDSELPSDSDTTPQFAWDDAPDLISSCNAYSRLGQAFEEIDPSLKSITRVSILRHPLNGPFFMAQAPIHPS